MDESKALVPLSTGKPKPRYLPKVENDEYRAMYKFYESLGPRRTFVRVAEKFEKSVGTVAKVSKSFDWKLRIRDHLPVLDRVMEQAREDIDASRTKLIDVVVEISDTLHELATIARRVKHATGPDPELMARRDILLESLGIWGFEWKSPKDFKALMDTLKAVAEVNDVDVRRRKEAANRPVSEVNNPTQINCEKFELNITDE